MTVTEIHLKVAEKKPVSLPTLYKHLRDLNIKPIGARQIPQRYPEDSAERILRNLGFASTTKRKKGGVR